MPSKKKKRIKLDKELQLSIRRQQENMECQANIKQLPSYS